MIVLGGQQRDWPYLYMYSFQEKFFKLAVELNCFLLPFLASHLLIHFLTWVLITHFTWTSLLASPVIFILPLSEPFTKLSWCFSIKGHIYQYVPALTSVALICGHSPISLNLSAQYLKVAASLSDLEMWKVASLCSKFSSSFLS